MAIEYPKEYRSEVNFFHIKVHVIASEEIVAPINKYIDFSKESLNMIHFLPPNCRHKVVTNKDHKMKLHY